MENNEDKDKVGKPEDTGEGDKSELAKQTEAANATIERMVKAKEELDAAEAKRKLGGQSAGQVPTETKKLTDKEYAESISRGIIPEEGK